MKQVLTALRGKAEEIRCDGALSNHTLTGKQGAYVDTADMPHVLNLCANNYLGFAADPDVEAAAIEGCKRWGFGLASVRKICGEQSVHLALEKKISAFVSMEDALLYTSAFDANESLFTALLGPEDAVISDEMNHASLIDGIRLCKAKRFRYKNNDMNDLRRALVQAQDARVKLIATDGVFSMEGTVANLPAICALAETYDALVLADDSHATGLIGDHGRGSASFTGAAPDILSGTFGKALGGACGGFICANRDIVTILRAHARPYTFSNTLPPAICTASLYVLDALEASDTRQQTLLSNAAYFRRRMKETGFAIPDGEHPIVPIILRDEALTVKAANMLWKKGILVKAVVYPAVPQGMARIRTQVSAVHTPDDLEFAVQSFLAVRDALGIGR